MRSPAARSRRNSRMKVAGQAMRTIWVEPDGAGIGIIDQTQLPFALVKRRLITLEEAAQAIRAMLVRGAPLIGVTAAYGMALAMRADPTDAAIDRAAATLLATRPTAVNLRWAVEDLRRLLHQTPAARRAEAGGRGAGETVEPDVASNRAGDGQGPRVIRDERGEKAKRPAVAG